MFGPTHTPRRLRKLRRTYRGVCRRLTRWLKTPYGGRLNRRRTLQAILDLHRPDLDSLARATGLAYRTVRRHLDDLERLGVVVTSTYPRTARPASAGWNALLRDVLLAVDGDHLLGDSEAPPPALAGDVSERRLNVSERGATTTVPRCTGGSAGVTHDPLARDDGKDPPTPPPEWFTER